MNRDEGKKMGKIKEIDGYRKLLVSPINLNTDLGGKDFC